VIVAVLVVMFVNIATVLETIATVGYETFRIDWHWDRAFKFARWQHPAVRHRARFPLFGTSNLGQFKRSLKTFLFGL